MKRRDWESQARNRTEYGRFEEMGSSDNSDEQGHSSDPRFRDEHFTSDELRFTGIDPSSLSVHGKSHVYSDDSDISDQSLEHSVEFRDGAAMQVALRDKEEQLVRTAMERIHRAQMLGKTNVRLTQPELDALERQRQLSAAAGKLKGRPSVPSNSNNERRSSKYGRTVDSQPTSLPEPHKRNSRTLFARRYKDKEPVSPEMSPPGFLVPGVDGALVYAPFSHHDVPAASVSRPGSRSASSHDQRQYHRTLPVPQHQQQQQQRYFSVPESSSSAARPLSSSSRGSPRPLPDDPNWIPRVRSASSMQPHSVDPFQYQTYSPPTPHLASQYTQGRRIVTGPPDVQYSSIRRVPPNVHMANSRTAASPPDASSPRLQPNREWDSYSGEEDDGYDDIGKDQDVRVDDTSSRGGYFSRIASGGFAGGRQRKGRR